MVVEVDPGSTLWCQRHTVVPDWTHLAATGSPFPERKSCDAMGFRKIEPDTGRLISRISFCSGRLRFAIDNPGRVLPRKTVESRHPNSLFLGPAGRSRRCVAFQGDD